MKLKKILNMLIVFVMVVSMLPMQISAAETELPVNGNVIDIADNALNGYTITQMTVNGATVQSTTQDGTTINVVLAADTALNASISVVFSGSGQLSLNQQNCTGKLSNGELTLSLTILLMQSNCPLPQAGYTINFSTIKGEAVAVTAPIGEGFTFAGKDTAYIDGAYSFTITINEGYDGASMTVKVNGETIDGNNGSYTVDNVTETLIITVEGVIEKTLKTVTLTEGEGYTSTPALSKAYNKLLFEDAASTADNYQMIILDEMLDAVEYGYIDENELVKLLTELKAHSEIVLTGHSLPERIADVSDYISEIKEISHPYTKGVSPRKGIEF